MHGVVAELGRVHEGMSIDYRLSLSKKDRQRVGWDDDPSNHHSVELAFAEISCRVEGEAHARSSDFLDRSKSLCKDVGYAVRVDQARQNILLQVVAPFWFSLLASCQTRRIGRGGGDSLSACANTVNKSARGGCT